MMKQKKILIVSGDPGLLDALQNNLPGRGYKVENTGDCGEELRDMIDQVSPDLVILDIFMPHLDGIELCLRIRQWCNVPIIMLSSWGASGNKVRGLDLSADSYLTEPFGFPELITRIERTLSRN